MLPLGRILLLLWVSGSRGFAPWRTTARLPVGLFSTTVDRDVQIQQLLQRARELGPIGKDRTPEEQNELLELAQAAVPLSDPAPARQTLEGLHTLQYSAAQGSSSGKIGPFVGPVTQQFVDDEFFRNTVDFGPVQISLLASREVKSDRDIKVTFLKSTVSLFGNKVTEKELERGRGGVWKYLFYGEITDVDGKRKLVRAMETPSLFILEQAVS